VDIGSLKSEAQRKNEVALRSWPPPRVVVACSVGVRPRSSTVAAHSSLRTKYGWIYIKQTQNDNLRTPSSKDISKIDRRIFQHALARAGVGGRRAWGWQGLVLDTLGRDQAV
jgi:hypothetical protein